MNNAVTSLQSTVAGKQDKLTFDSTPTSGSNNPVTSGGIYNAINGFVSKSGTTMTGILVAYSNSSYTTKQVRNITLSTSDPSGGSNGDIWIKYS